MGKTWMLVDFGGGNKIWLTILVLTPLTQDVVATAADLSNGSPAPATSWSMAFSSTPLRPM
jgi:hypothetical protein